MRLTATQPDGIMLITQHMFNTVQTAALQMTQ